ncbi:hypothetical protein [Granulicella arctica]|uniref:hypothetical protein n=1 Tax=Granulicella arctica TaxID=940613 RepID=UPI0021E09799|nr:hypothetical protein [Granulicella arctica]
MNHAGAAPVPGPILNRIGFAYAAALAGWTVAWCITIAYFTIVPLLHHFHPLRGADQWGDLLIYLISTLLFVLLDTTIFGVPHVAIRSAQSMLRHPGASISNPASSA